jgi:hypothetical protein
MFISNQMGRLSVFEPLYVNVVRFFITEEAVFTLRSKSRSGRL